MAILVLKNWERFQHYKDRDPPWIKLHRDLLSSECWVEATDQQRLWLITVMLMAARHNNEIPAKASYIQKAAHLDVPPDLDWLVEVGFCVYAEQVATQGAEQKPKVKWASRYISAQTRAAILERDGGKCLKCASTADLEIDHIKPISQGGDGNYENLQTLCRSCNRAKRARVADARQTLRRTSRERSLESDQRQGREEQKDLNGHEVPSMKPEPIAQVFEHWRVTHSHPKAVLDAKRERLIRGALKLYPPETLCTAISGYRNSKFHMGENDRKTVYDDIELMLRDAKQIDAGLKFSEKSGEINWQ